MTTLEIIFTILAGALGGGWAWDAIFFRQRRRKEIASADQAETNNGILVANEWREVAEKREIKLDKQSDLIERLYSDIKDLRNDAHRLLSEKQQLELELLNSKAKECIVRACDGRQPKSEYY